MKHLLTLLSLSLLLVTSCNNSSKETEKQSLNNSTQAEEEVEESAPINSKGKVIHLTTQQFKDQVHNFDQHPNTWVFRGDKPCMIDLYADWCAPCRQIAPFMDEIAEKYKDEINVYKINIDNEPQLASYFGVQSIPLVVWAPLNGELGGQPGMLTKEQYIMIVDSILLKK